MPQNNARGCYRWSAINITERVSGNSGGKKEKAQFASLAQAGTCRLLCVCGDFDLRVLVVIFEVEVKTAGQGRRERLVKENRG